MVSGSDCADAKVVGTVTIAAGNNTYNSISMHFNVLAVINDFIAILSINAAKIDLYIETSKISADKLSNIQYNTQVSDLDFEVEFIA